MGVLFIFLMLYFLDINLNPAKINFTVGKDLVLHWKQPENYISTTNAKLKYNVRLDFFQMNPTGILLYCLCDK